MSYGSSREASYQITRLANTLDEMNRKLTRALLDLERINQRLDSVAAQERAQEREQAEEPARAEATS